MKEPPPARGAEEVTKGSNRGTKGGFEGTRGGLRPPTQRVAAATLCVPQVPQKRLGGTLGDLFGTLGFGPVPQKRLGGPLGDPFGKTDFRKKHETPKFTK